MPAVPPPTPPRVSVVGASAASDEERGLARAVGEALAGAGAVLVCGGLGGVMEAAARGCREAGGRTVGLLPGDDPADANPWIEVPIPTGMGEGRNVLVVRSGEGVVSVGGAWGTLSELALARALGRPVVTLGTPPADLALPAADGPEEAVATILAAIRARRSA